MYIIAQMFIDLLRPMMIVYQDWEELEGEEASKEETYGELSHLVTTS
jgi:hypothetical protein